jgi:hypothetical protein
MKARVRGIEGKWANIRCTMCNHPLKLHRPATIRKGVEGFQCWANLGTIKHESFDHPGKIVKRRVTCLELASFRGDGKGNWVKHGEGCALTNLEMLEMLDKLQEKE